MARAKKIPSCASVDSRSRNRHMKYTKTSSGRMAVSAKMVLAASRSFTGRSPTLDPPKGKPDDRVPSLSPSVPGAGADSKEKRLVETRLRTRQKLQKKWNAGNALQAR